MWEDGGRVSISNGRLEDVRRLKRIPGSIGQGEGVGLELRGDAVDGGDEICISDRGVK
jgi:hypothetical protein